MEGKPDELKFGPEKKEDKMSVKRWMEIRNVLKDSGISAKELLIYIEILSKKSKSIIEDLKEWDPSDVDEPTKEELDDWLKGEEK